MTKPASGRKAPPTWRRQFNESFQNPDGSFSPAKAIAITGQLIALFHFNLNFVALIERWDSLLVILSFIIAPDLVKKIVNMKYGNGNAANGHAK